MQCCNWSHSSCVQHIAHDAVILQAAVHKGEPALICVNTSLRPYSHIPDRICLKPWPPPPILVWTPTKPNSKQSHVTATHMEKILRLQKRNVRQKNKTISLDQHRGLFVSKILSVVLIRVGFVSHKDVAEVALDSRGDHFVFRLIPAWRMDQYGFQAKMAYLNFDRNLLFDFDNSGQETRQRSILREECRGNPWGEG